MSDPWVSARAVLAAASALTVLVAGEGAGQETGKASEPGWTGTFNMQSCTFSTTGENEHFILKPGYRLTLAGVEDEDTVKLAITVLDDTLDVGGVQTRVVEERETVNGSVSEISRNYFAFCVQTSTVFYFGEDVDIYKDGKVVSHEGAWRAGSGAATAGVMMPGLPLLGARYYQEIAPEIAMDRAEIISLSEVLRTSAGTFERCLKTKETTPLEPGNAEYKIYAPGIGLVRDGNLLLTTHGYVARR